MAEQFTWHVCMNIMVAPSTFGSGGLVRLAAKGEILRVADSTSSVVTGCVLKRAVWVCRLLVGGGCFGTTRAVESSWIFWLNSLTRSAKLKWDGSSSSSDFCLPFEAEPVTVVWGTENVQTCWRNHAKREIKKTEKYNRKTAFHKQYPMNNVYIKIPCNVRNNTHYNTQLHEQWKPKMRRIETAVRGYAEVDLQPIRENTGTNNLIVLLGKCFICDSTGRYNTSLIFGSGFCERTSFHHIFLLVFQSAFHLLWCLFTRLFHTKCLRPRV